MMMLLDQLFKDVTVFSEINHKEDLKMKRFAFMVAVMLMASSLGSTVSAAEKKAAKTAAASKNFKDKNTGMEFVFVKGGCFQMGDAFGDGAAEEKPVHKVCVGNFHMGKYEVTQGQWQQVMGENPSKFKQCGLDCPVENVSWNDAQEFISRLNKKSGAKYRLPTEAEWEYAARSGGKKEKLAGGGKLNDIGWYAGNSGGTTHPAGKKQPNGLGLYDMSGNVFEWCNDWHDDAYYTDSPQQNPKGPAKGADRVARGGSYEDEPESLRTVNRNYNNVDFRNGNFGLRLVSP
jgi:formylglycine-generating enzyme required for sulfatase activity